MTLLADFKKFLLRGSVVDLAVAVVIGTAFAAVVKALVADLLTPIIALIVGKPSFQDLSFTLNKSHFLYGDFVNNVITFVSIAAAVLLRRGPGQQADGPPRARGPGHKGVSGVHERDTAAGATLPAVHGTDRGRRRRLASYSASCW